MSEDSRVFVRIPKAIYKKCEQAAKRRGMKPGQIAREWLLKGLDELAGETPPVVRGPYDRNVNMLMPDDKLARLAALRQVEEERIGQALDVGAYARRLLLLGMIAAEREESRAA